MQGQRSAGSCVLVALLSASTTMAQAPPDRTTREWSEVETTTPQEIPAPPTRAIVFTPDRPEATLEFRGVGLVNNIWKDGWIPVCVGRCVGDVPLAEKYRIAGPGVNNSRLFPIGPGVTPLYLEAKTGSFAGRSIGTVATVLGGIALPLGLLAAGFADFCIGDGGAKCEDRSTQKVVGFVAAGLGAATLVTGILMLVHNRTIVSGDEPRGGSP